MKVFSLIILVMLMSYGLALDVRYPYDTTYSVIYENNNGVINPLKFRIYNASNNTYTGTCYLTSYGINENVIEDSLTIGVDYSNQYSYMFNANDYADGDYVFNIYCSDDIQFNIGVKIISRGNTDYLNQTQELFSGLDLTNGKTVNGVKNIVIGINDIVDLGQNYLYYIIYFMGFLLGLLLSIIGALYIIVGIVGILGSFGLVILIMLLEFIFMYFSFAINKKRGFGNSLHTFLTYNMKTFEGVIWFIVLVLNTFVNVAKLIYDMIPLIIGFILFIVGLVAFSGSFFLNNLASSLSVLFPNKK